ncbi:EF-hand domain-containing protein [Novosphingobium taihuense]|uniref:Ca2+-binding EF-hand superfamily protein n=1 Tax=Novosphingobium taihuense TaxID=260085 RepID=A0A7W7AFA3_9SPHN|nr:EF-hand domain-containing protein [Novosphingobium taihuense]MBB4615861.1 Ca2+-binding EF-hand superfamily protein [Novosphingobium taihuense]TWH79119.1 EF hand domain-containing protein [Novosphingobium taihuense]
MKKFQIAALAAVTATASMALYAASPAFAQKMDADGDKTITWAEAKAKSDEMWTKLDVNKDGKLDQADKSAKWAEKFAVIDTDKNGSISQAEFIAHHQQMKGHEGQAGERKGRHGRGHGGMRGMMMGGHMAMMADANKDGTVTRAEFDAGVKAHFDMADANKDGKITPEERRASMKAMMGKMKGPHAGHMGAMGDGPPPPPPAN